MNSYPVKNSEDLKRVLALPRRQWAPGQAEALSETWSPALLNAAGLRHWERCAQLPPAHREAELKRLKIRLKPVQVMMLSEAWQCRGLHALAPVGAGKTLFTWLAPIGMPMPDGTVGAKRPVLMVPANLEGKTSREFAELAKLWRSPRPPPRLVNYTIIGRVEHKHLLHEIKPDLLICDESDLLRNPKSAKSRRVARYMADHPETIFISTTGTDMRKTLRDFSRHMVWALKWQAPVPLSWTNQQEWCEALDEKPRDGRRRPLGALRFLAEPNELEKVAGDAGLELRAVCEGYAKRIAETPGIIVHDEQSCSREITVRVVKAPDDRVLDDAFLRFRKTASTPDGWDLSDPLSELRHGTELGCGFYYKWDPRPPLDWLNARRDWCKFVSETIQKSQRTRRPLETEAEVARAHEGNEVLEHWREIKGTFEPNTVPVPLTSSVLGYASQWLSQEGPGLIWVQHTWAGETLAQMLKLPYFGPQGRTSKTAAYAWRGSIDDYEPGKSAIVSMHSNRRGRNLQTLHKNLIIGPEHSGERWEQMLGRTHRQGQERDVHVDVLISCRENLRALDAACTEARRVNTHRGVSQKLLIAGWDWSLYPAVELDNLPINHPSRARW